ncbi:hypothetical protein [Metabacillus halosaccharovorans]|uniref:hypothetical protein n=1 Tax=Metabacillus halosaccharovorans TaxID=930124 RepID=UPI00204184F7|nr:hypothetical protein [Metabacillus halosaccharovorans]MCM3444506.1 hypothetical protein [Metabacillus halosaccharovorans]
MGITYTNELPNGIKQGYDYDTGEKMVSIPDNGEFLITSRKKVNAYKELIKNSREQPSYTCSNMDSIKEVIRTLEEKHCGYLLYLQCFMDFGGLLIKGSKYKDPMNKNDIQKVLGLGRTAFSYFFNTMIKNHIIQQEGEHFRVNAKYHWKGDSNVTNLIRSYTTTLKELYKSVNAKDLGFIYKLLPYVHKETNFLCENPIEKNPLLIRPLNKKNIARIVGVDEKTVYRKLLKLKLSDMYVFAEVSKGGVNNAYMINPFIFYRKGGKPDKTLKTIFLFSPQK